jgi:hypothetical protein
VTDEIGHSFVHDALGPVMEQALDGVRVRVTPMPHPLPRPAPREYEF